MTTSDVSRARAWLMAARPQTMPAAVAPVVVGTGLAAAEGVFAALPAAAALLGAALIQVGTNFANDYFDAKSGADRDRIGPTRVTQAGLVSPSQIKAAIALSFGAAILCGLYLLAVGGWPIALIGILSLLSGFAYTGGPFPLGYNGLGDLFVLVFFGLVAVSGTYYVQALSWSPLALWLALPVGMLSTAILVVNNLRDRETDARSGKRTLVVMLGDRFGRVEYVTMLAVSFLLPVGLVIANALPIGALLCLLALIPAVKPLRVIWAGTGGAALNPILAATSEVLVYFGLFLSVGLALG